MRRSAAGEPSVVKVIAAALQLQLRAAPVLFSAAIGVSVVSGLTAPLAASLLRHLLDVLQQHGHPAHTLSITLPFVAISAVSAGFVYVGAAFTNLAQRRMAIYAEDEMFRRTNALRGLKYFEQAEFLDRLQLAEQGIQGAPQAITSTGQQALRGGVMMVGYGVGLAKIWWPGLLIMTLSVWPLVWGQLAIARRRAAVARLMAGSYRRRYAYRELLTNAGSAKEIRLFAIGSMVHSRLVAALKRASNAEAQVETRATLLQLTLTVAGEVLIGIGLVILIGEAAGGKLPVGDVVFYIAAMTGLQGVVTAMVSQATYAGPLVTLFRAFVSLGTAPEDLCDGERSVEQLTSAVAFNDVWFRYHESHSWVLQGLTMTIRRGKTIGIVGANGAGKSTFIKLLCRFYDPERGSIMWDGRDIRGLRLDELRARLGGTFQDFTRYDLTARENIGIGYLPECASIARVAETAGAAGIAAKIESLAHGYDTLLSTSFVDEQHDQQGANLSGGEWQRVAIARGLMRPHADVLILDEPSSGLDADAENRLNQAVLQKSAGQTRIIISHRLAAMRYADEIFVLADGKVAEHGTHDELMDHNGEYARMFRVQAQSYQDARVTAV